MICGTAAGRMVATVRTLLRSPATVDTRRIPSEVIPEPRNRLFGQAVIAEPSPVPIEDGEFVLGHDVCVRLRLDPVPYFPRGSFEHRVDRRRMLAVLVVLNDLECLGQSYMIVRSTTHVAFNCHYHKSERWMGNFTVRCKAGSVQKRYQQADHQTTLKWTHL